MVIHQFKKNTKTLAAMIFSIQIQTTMRTIITQRRNRIQQEYLDKIILLVLMKKDIGIKNFLSIT